MSTRPPAAAPADLWAGRDFLHAVAGPASRFPPLRVLFLAHRVGATGRLSFRARGDERVIDLMNGAVCGSEGIGNLLSGLGVDSTDSTALSAQIAQAIRQGTSPDRALDVAGQGLGLALARIAAVDDDPVRFVAGPCWSGPPTTLPMSLPRILATGLRAARSADVVRRELGRHRNAALRVALPDDAPESQWGLSPVAFRLLRDAARASTLGELLGSARGGETDETWQSVDLLLHLGLLNLERVAGPAPLSEAERARLTELKDTAARIRQMPFAELFEMEKSAQATEAGLERAFRSLSAKFHPDRMLGEPEAVREAGALCFGLINEARERVLADPEALRELAERLRAAEEGRVYVSARDKLAGEMAYKAAEFALRKKDFVEAWDKASEAARLNPADKRPEWILAQTGFRAGKMTLAEAVEKLGAVGGKDNKLKAECAFQAGELLVSQGKEAQAEKHFQRAVELDAEHIGARRRLRLKEMRERPQAPPESAGSAFSMNALKGLFGGFGAKAEPDAKGKGPTPPAKGRS
jgi:curved DNA-binding protein CbpA